MACKSFLTHPFAFLLTSHHSTVRPITDVEDRVVAVLGGSPRDPDWKGVGDGASEAMKKTRTKLDEAGVLRDKHYSHRRGEFCALAVGCSHGGGRKVHQLLAFCLNQLTSFQRPGLIANPPAIALALRKLVKHPSFQRIAGFANSMYPQLHPQLYTYEHFQVLSGFSLHGCTATTGPTWISFMCSTQLFIGISRTELGLQRPSTSALALSRSPTQTQVTHSLAGVPSLASGRSTTSGAATSFYGISVLLLNSLLLQPSLSLRP